VTEYLVTAAANPLAPAAALLGSAAALVLTALAALMGLRRQRKALARLDERLTQLSAGLSLLTNTTEDGFRGVAIEVARLSGAADVRPRPPAGTRQRVATAAGHGRSVQDIAAAEHISEGEVLLHLLVEKLRPEPANAEMC
jgi:hypothetical protein